MVKIGHASSDERGKYSGGQAGDQTVREVCVRDWYNRPWNKVLRPRRLDVANRSVRACREACYNDKIGYDQNQRTTLYTQAKAKDWNLAAITTACECDCSSLMAVCAIAAGVNVSKDIYTGNMVRALAATGEYDVLTDGKYLASDDYLMPGDILVYEGHHTAMALQYGSRARFRTGWNYDLYGWWYATTETAYYKSCWRDINGHRYYFNPDGYAVTNWQEIGGKWYYFEPRAGHELECALYRTDADGAQDPGVF